MVRGLDLFFDVVEDFLKRPGSVVSAVQISSAPERITHGASIPAGE
jgi:hypothetical protein